MLSHSVSIALVHLSHEIEIMSLSDQTRTLPTVGVGTNPRMVLTFLSRNDWLLPHISHSTCLTRLSEATKQFDYKLED